MIIEGNSGKFHRVITPCGCEIYVNFNDEEPVGVNFCPTYRKQIEDEKKL